MPNVFDQPPFDQIIHSFAGNFGEESPTKPLKEAVKMAARYDIEPTPENFSRLFVGQASKMLFSILDGSSSPTVEDFAASFIVSQKNNYSPVASFLKQMQILFSGHNQFRPMVEELIRNLADERGWTIFLNNQIPDTKGGPVNKFGFITQPGAVVPNFRDWQKKKFSLDQRSLAGLKDELGKNNTWSGGLPGFTGDIGTGWRKRK